MYTVKRESQSLFSVDAQSLRELSGTGETMNVDTGDLFLYCSHSGSCTHGRSLNASLGRVRIASRDLLTTGQTLPLMKDYRLGDREWYVRFFICFIPGSLRVEILARTKIQGFND